jgi:hypothetical protein
MWPSDTPTSGITFIWELVVQDVCHFPVIGAPFFENKHEEYLHHPAPELRCLIISFTDGASLLKQFVPRHIYWWFPFKRCIKSSLHYNLRRRFVKPGDSFSFIVLYVLCLYRGGFPHAPRPYVVYCTSPMDIQTVAIRTHRASPLVPATREQRN